MAEQVVSVPDSAAAAPCVCASASCAESGAGVRLGSTLSRLQQVHHTRGVFDPDNPVLREAVGSRQPLVVCTPSVDRLYGQQLREYLRTLPFPPAHGVVVLGRNEVSKSLDAVVEVVEHAAVGGLLRTAPIVAVGGGVCTDVCGFAAAVYRRGVPHIKIATTLVGLVDAGIGTKNAVNHGDHKSLLGSFHPPEHSILDPGFLLTLSVRHLRNGLAEIVKLAVVADPALFDLLTRFGAALLRSGFRSPADAGEQVVGRAVDGMLGQLSENLFEHLDYRRKVDFGHTLSPYLEVASGHTILHGEAVAMDVALSSQLACDLGLLGAADLDRILGLLTGLGLDLAWPLTQVDALWATLSTVREHRNGDLHLVAPTGIGSCTYLGLDALTPRMLQDAHQRLLLRPAPSPARALDEAGSR